jgi:hypothetical protein
MVVAAFGHIRGLDGCAARAVLHGEMKAPDKKQRKAQSPRGFYG